MQLREWQKDCLEKIKTGIDNLQTSFTVVACPGAGKSILQAVFAKHLLDKGLVDYILNIVPSDTLRNSNARVFKDSVGINLCTVRPGNGEMEQGFVTTYQMISRRMNLDALVTPLTKEGKRFAVIADEVHHGSSHEDSRYGDVLSQIVERATFSLTVSGTLWRSDKQLISGVTYEQGPEGYYAVPDFEYSLEQATLDGVVVPVHFSELNGSVVFQVKDLVTQETTNKVVNGTSRATEHRAKAAYKHLMNPEGEFCKELLRQASSELSVKIRKHNTLTPEALPPAGLVVASSKNHAEKIALLLKEITGEEPAVVHGDRLNNKETIQQFTDGELPNQWLVSVGMVSEGVDIPRIKVLAYLTTARTELVFHQIVGRSMRTRVGPDGEALSEYSSVFMPSTPALHRYVSSFVVSQPKVASKSLKELVLEEEDLVLEEEVPELKKMEQDLIMSSVIGIQKFLNGIEQSTDAVTTFIAQMMSQLQALMLANERQKV